MKIALKNKAGVTKRAKIGFSWTLFFFGAITYMIRGQWGEAIKSILLAGITIGIYPFVQCFTGNRKTIEHLIERGYEPASKLDQDALQSAGIISL